MSSAYLTGYLRLGIMARDSGQIHEASKWFKQALEVDGENPDIVAYIGNLHMRNSEWGPAQKKFEKILEMVRVDGGTRCPKLFSLSVPWVLVNATFPCTTRPLCSTSFRALKYLTAVCNA